MLSEYDFEVEHVPGADNHLADYLSRSVASIVNVRTKVGKGYQPWGRTSDSTGERTEGRMDSMGTNAPLEEHDVMGEPFEGMDRAGPTEGADAEPMLEELLRRRKVSRRKGTAFEEYVDYVRSVQREDSLCRVLLEYLRNGRLPTEPEMQLDTLTYGPFCHEKDGILLWGPPRPRRIGRQHVQRLDVREPDPVSQTVGRWV